MRQSNKLAGDHINSEIINTGVIGRPPWQRAGFFTYGDYWFNRNKSSRPAGCHFKLA